uniref:Uncharacterized protein n=1 Tax=Oryza barthii TaxID=65489 RepID=A0A0D3GEY4_9ORYZ
MASCDVASSGGNGVNFIDGGDGDFKRLRWLPVASQWWRRLLHAAAVASLLLDHILASAEIPDNVLSLRYDLLCDLAGSWHEEEAGIVEAIVKLCSLDNMRGFEVNKTGYVVAQRKISREISPLLEGHDRVTGQTT